MDGNEGDFSIDLVPIQLTVSQPILRVLLQLDVHVAEYKDHLRRDGFPNVISDRVNCYISDAVVDAVWTLAKMELISCIIRLLGTCK